MNPVIFNTASPKERQWTHLWGRRGIPNAVLSRTPY